MATLRKRRLPSHLARPSPPLTHFQKLVRRGPPVPSDASFNRLDYTRPVPLLSRQPFLEQFTSYELQHFTLHGHTMSHCRWVATPGADQLTHLDRLERARRDPFFRPYAELAIRQFKSRMPHEPVRVSVEGFQPPGANPAALGPGSPAAPPPPTAPSPIAGLICAAAAAGHVVPLPRQPGFPSPEPRISLVLPEPTPLELRGSPPLDPVDRIQPPEPSETENMAQVPSAGVPLDSLEPPDTPQAPEEHVNAIPPAHMPDTDEHGRDVRLLLLEMSDVFALSKFDVGGVDPDKWGYFRIDTGDHPPIFSAKRRLSHTENQQLKQTRARVCHGRHHRGRR